jgi:hypothetical protein
MKHLFIAVLFFTSCKHAEHKNLLLHITNDRKEAHLKGKVKKLIETESQFRYKGTVTNNAGRQEKININVSILSGGVYFVELIVIDGYKKATAPTIR